VSGHSTARLAVQFKRSMIYDVSRTLAMQASEIALIDNHSAAVLCMTHKLATGTGVGRSGSLATYFALTFYDQITNVLHNSYY
jgi:hypothetical protein